MPVRDKINQLNEHCWFTNIQRQKSWEGKEFWFYLICAGCTGSTEPRGLNK